MIILAIGLMLCSLPVFRIALWARGLSQRFAQDALYRQNMCADLERLQTEVEQVRDYLSDPTRPLPEVLALAKKLSDATKQYCDEYRRIYPTTLNWT